MAILGCVYRHWQRTGCICNNSVPRGVSAASRPSTAWKIRRVDTTPATAKDGCYHHVLHRNNNRMINAVNM
jgi:hypothetical protein